MIKTFFKKITTAVLMFVLFYSIVVDPFVANAQALNMTETIDTLTARLIELGNVIATSPNITEPERLSLMLALVAASTGILELRKSQYYYSEPAPVSDETKETAKAAGLTLVKTYYDSKTNLSTIVTVIGGAQATTTATFAELNAIPNFVKICIKSIRHHKGWVFM